MFPTSALLAQVEEEAGFFLQCLDGVEKLLSKIFYHRLHFPRLLARDSRILLLLFSAFCCCWHFWISVSFIYMSGIYEVKNKTQGSHHYIIPGIPSFLTSLSPLSFSESSFVCFKKWQGFWLHSVECIWESTSTPSSQMQILQFTLKIH